MTENQKLREVLQHAIEDLSSATGFLTRRSRDRQSKTVAALAKLQADIIALPTAEPVDERLTLSAEDVHAAFVKHFPKTRISQAWIGFAAEIAEAMQARAALSAGDAVDAQRYRWLMDNCTLGIKQNGVGWSLNTSACVAPDCIKDVGDAIDAALRKDKP